ncbi:MAG: hypothetical protein JXQ81_13585 [Desulfuromonadales bacterium]|nr:hypothetical protein [Desulfuromonadales bacterium]MBN2793538.1 hypothetical protein [Desulfuromonadales bacterium]
MGQSLNSFASDLTLKIFLVWILSVPLLLSAAAIKMNSGVFGVLGALVAIFLF